MIHRVKLIEQARRREPQGGARLARRPYVDQTVQRVFFLLQPQLVARAAGHIRRAAPEAAPLIANDRLHGRQQLGGGHQADGDAGALEHGLDHLAVVVARHDDAVLDRVAADNPAGGHIETEDRVVGR